MTKATLTFGGTATTLLRLGDFTLLTDPNFVHRGERVHLGYGLFSKRRTEPALLPGNLPKLDALLLSHLHADHFDRVARDTLRHDLPIVTTGHAAKRLRQWGFGDTVPLGTWESYSFTRGDQRLTVTATPGTHGPGPMARLLPPVMGSVVELAEAGETRLRLYVTGDTLFRPWLGEVAERFGPLDAVVAHLGGTRVLGVLVTMDAKQGADLVELLRPEVTIPVHYDDYTVFRSPLSDFLATAQRRALPTQIRTVMRGELVELPLRPAAVPAPALAQGLPVPNATRT
jgi:L-ascorbate metabolism protein UlaG (beta-lactamase superfamily)